MVYQIENIYRDAKYKKEQNRNSWVEKHNNWNESLLEGFNNRFK